MPLTTSHLTKLISVGFSKRFSIVVTGIVLALSSCSLPGRLARGYAEADPVGIELIESEGALADAPPPELRGQVRFVFDDFGGLSTDVLETYAMPWKLFAAALVRNRHVRRGAPISRRTLDRVFADYGFIRPRAIANWVGRQPHFERPLGLLAGTARRGFPPIEVEIVNLGCATCHAGPLYGADGHRTGEAWLGLPNSSLDLSAYGAEAFEALRAELDQPETLLETIVVLFPDVSERELWTIRKYLIPGTREGLEARYAAFGGLLPFENGGPGLMNGVGSLRFLLGGSNHESVSSRPTWTSAPELSGTTLRRSLLIDGVYASPQSSRFGPMTRDDVTDAHLEELAGIVSLFIVGTQGVQPQSARKAIPEVYDVMKFAHTMEPPPFPGSIDNALAARGAVLYEGGCASCHGRYSPGLSGVQLIEHPNRLVTQHRMLTDSVRWATVDPGTPELIEQIGYGREIEPLNSGGYVTPDLSGIWATAPYLHNGSVPTLWHLLHHEERPERFYVGGHALDYELMGIAGTTTHDGIYSYPKDYTPWARPFLYDTRESGRSNAGHEFLNLSEREKRALLEYMKVL